MINVRSPEMQKDEYIKKLERRVHNQRVQLRINYDILREQLRWKKTPLTSMWFDLLKKRTIELNELKDAKAK